MAPKRSRHDGRRSGQLNDDDDIEQSLKKRAFPLHEYEEQLAGAADTPADPDAPPMSAIEYLKRVRTEAEMYPSFKTAVLEPHLQQQSAPAASGAAKNPLDIRAMYFGSPQLHQEPACAIIYRPSKLWIDQFIQDFSVLHAAIQKQYLHQRSKAKPAMRLPAIGDERGWKRMILGRSQVSERVDPLLSILNVLDQSKVVILLSHCHRWCQNSDFENVLQSQWMFALLLRLDPLLTSDQITVLRDVCRKCIKLRAELDPETTDPGASIVAALNIVISIISVFFGQKDLRDTEFSDSKWAENMARDYRGRRDGSQPSISPPRGRPHDSEHSTLHASELVEPRQRGGAGMEPSDDAEDGELVELDDFEDVQVQGRMDSEPMRNEAGQTDVYGPSNDDNDNDDNDNDDNDNDDGVKSTKMKRARWWHEAQCRLQSSFMAGISGGAPRGCTAHDGGVYHETASTDHHQRRRTRFDFGRLVLAGVSHQSPRRDGQLRNSREWTPGTSLAQRGETQRH
ncbi:survival motor neuron interacting protein 1-domain-containing protein [Polychytrium aggregatum]|uniref:survival motor neuron interacting protein 1-domain-containing protein n=1 Tax=Polychytrium aggregatum TaxID=110093 RepID=UPI0022FEB53D|nr:survival motor neuron interacting protein 1-domain-containing protein [Polychytrium aggregatum]KAI9202865.1 survival motor neuron interacting protein 1-domain-containing protein [Polychytrium aggregatum]